MAGVVPTREAYTLLGAVAITVPTRSKTSGLISSPAEACPSSASALRSSSLRCDAQVAPA